MLKCMKANAVIGLLVAALFALPAGLADGASDNYLKIKMEATVEAGATTTESGKGNSDEKAKGIDKASPKLQETARGENATGTDDDVLREDCPSERPACESGESPVCRRGVWYCRGDSARGSAQSATTTRGNAVSVSAREMRGWDPKQKQEFLATVKAHAEVQSGQDLENFARGVLLQDENVEELAVEEEKLVVKYLSRGKFLGFIPLSFTQTVELDTEGDDMGRVKVRMPWFAFLLRADVSAEELENELGINEKWMRASWNAAEIAEAFNILTSVLKTKHDTAMAAIQNIR